MANEDQQLRAKIDDLQAGLAQETAHKRSLEAKLAKDAADRKKEEEVKERRHSREDQVGERDDEEGGGEGESEPEGREQHRQCQGCPIRQLFLQKGLDKERG